MRNKNVSKNLITCYQELRDIKQHINLKKTSATSAYLSNYAVIRATGSLESAFKHMLFESMVKSKTSKRISRFLEKTLIRKAQSIKLDQIYSTICKFDKDLKTSIKNDLEIIAKNSQVTSSLTSLAEVRNSIAHGGKSTMTINDVYQHFLRGCLLLKILDKRL